MPSFKYDPVAKQIVKISERVPLRGADGRPFAKQILDGYRRQEAKGTLRSSISPSRVKQLWA